MFFSKSYRSPLFEQFTIQTRKFIKILLRGEQFPGEYQRCKETLEALQKQLMWEEKRSAYNVSVSAPDKLLVRISKK